MATERPEKPGGRYVELEAGHRFSTSAHVELMRLVLGRGRTWRFRALGKSMTPFIRDGDDITLAPVSAEKDIGLGDVVAYIHRTPDGRQLVVHRVVGRRDSTYLIKADYALGHDPSSVRSGDIIGRVVRIERGEKRIEFGLGPERFVIAVLSRAGLLLPVLRHASLF